MENSFNEFAKKEKERERIGKIIILSICIPNLVFTLFNFIVNIQGTNIITSILGVVFTILLMLGFDWVRTLFGALLAWNAIWLTFTFFVLITDLDWWLIIVYVVLIVYCTTASALLFASRSVKEYLYVRKNG